MKYLDCFKGMGLTALSVSISACGSGGSSGTSPAPISVVPPPPPPAVAAQPLSLKLSLALMGRAGTVPEQYTYNVIVEKTSNTKVEDLSLFLRDLPDFMKFTSEKISFEQLPVNEAQTASGVLVLNPVVDGLIQSGSDAETMPLRWELTYKDIDSGEYKEIYLQTTTDIKFE